MDLSLRKPLFLAALVLLAIAVLVEVGSSLLQKAQPPDCSLLERLPKPIACAERPPANLPAACEAMRTSVCVEAKDEDVSFSDVLSTQRDNPPTPGMGIPYLALLDAMLLFTLVLMGASLIVPERVHGRVQGLATLIGSIVALLTGITLLMVAFGLLMTLKLAAGICLVLAHPRFLQNKGLVLLLLTSLLANAVVAFLHGLVPIILVSITDAIGAIIVAVLALIWAVVLLVGALVSILKVLRLKRVAA
jgi:hypothetical protein